MSLSPRFRLLLGAVILAMILLPWLGQPYLVYLLTLSMIFGIFALAYDLLYGFTGLVSFGHSVFYGMPAYAVGMVAVTVFKYPNPVVMIAAAMFSGLLLGCLIGFVCTFARGIYMALITFAFAQICELLVMHDPWGITQGENGIMGVRAAPITLGGLKLDLFAGVGLYYLVLGLIIVSYLVIRLLVNSPLGDVLKGIKQNEHRLLSLGYNPRPYKVAAFGLSGMFAGLAGAMAVFLNNSVVPSLVDWSVGAEILLITIMGGAGTLIGPVAAAFLIIFAESYASAYLGGGNWVYVMGGLYIAVVMFLPGGIFRTKYLKKAFA
ncbi:MAG: branched-chain amino acid ABC transporter permease [Thermodesulfobacteriota bacterium]